MTRVTLMLLLLFISMPFIGRVFSKGDANNHAVKVEVTTEFTLDTLTIYNPSPAQTAHPTRR